MTARTFFGCLFIAFGPSMAMFYFTIVQHPIRVIILVVGAFFWLMSLLLSALLWLAVVPLKAELAFSLIFSVLFQELMRFALFKLLSKAEAGLGYALTEEEKRSITGHRLSYVLGFGFGLMDGCFSIVNVLDLASGPGNVGLSSLSDNFFIESAFLTNCFILLHICWNVITFKLLKDKHYIQCSALVALHAVCSCVTLFNTQYNLAYVSLIVSYLALLFSSSWAFKIAGGSMRNIRMFVAASLSFA